MQKVQFPLALGRKMPGRQDEARRPHNRGAENGAEIHDVWPEVLRMTFDLERARGLRDFLQDDCAEVGDVWAEMVAEIERLRAMLKEAGQ